MITIFKVKDFDYITITFGADVHFLEIWRMSFLEMELTDLPLGLVLLVLTHYEKYRQLANDKL